MAGDDGEGGIGGLPASTSVVLRRRAQRRAIEAALLRRRRAAIVISGEASGPIEQDETEKHVLQVDFLNVVDAASDGTAEVEVTRDADGGMRFYAGPSGVLHSEVGAPVRTIASTTLTNLYSFTVPASTCAAGDKLRLELFFTVYQNSGSAQNVRLKLLGTAGTWHESAISMPNDADPYGVRVTIDLLYLGSSSQIMSFHSVASTAAASATGWGGWGGSQLNGSGFKTTSENQAADMAFTVQMRFDTSVVSSSINLYSAFLVRTPAST